MPEILDFHRLAFVSAEQLPMILHSRYARSEHQKRLKAFTSPSTLAGPDLSNMFLGQVMPAVHEAGKAFVHWPQHLSRWHDACSLQDNLLHGRFLAELTREVIDDLENSKYQHAEYRISIYGRKRVEWDTLAAWICQHQLASDNVLWLIQVAAASKIIHEWGVVGHVLQNSWASQHILPALMEGLLFNQLCSSICNCRSRPIAWPPHQS